MAILVEVHLPRATTAASCLLLRIDQDQTGRDCCSLQPLVRCDEREFVGIDPQVVPELQGRRQMHTI